MINDKSSQDIYNFDLSFLVAFTLLKDNIIVFSTKGFFTFNSNFENLYNYTFPLEILFDNYNNKKYYPSFSQFPEEDNGYVTLVNAIIDELEEHYDSSYCQLGVNMDFRLVQ